MNVIVVNDYACVQGGAAQVAVSSARGLADSGCKVYYVFAVGPAAPALTHPNIVLVDLQQYDLLSNPSRLQAAVEGVWNFSVEKQVLEFLSSFSSSDTVVHVHSWVKSLSCSVVSACLQRQLPVVLTLHDYFTACPNGGFYNFQKKSVCHLDAMSSACLLSNCDSRSYPQKLWRFLRQVVAARAGVPSAINNFIYVSEFSRKVLSDYLPGAATFWNVPNPIDIEKKPLSNPGRSDVFTFVGRFSPEKGCELFAEAVRNSGVRARFVGDGELLGHLKTVAPDAEFTGWADRGEVSNFISGSRAVVFPSQLYETQGMVVAEAAALGVPCIVSDACAGRDFVVDGGTGIWFKAADLLSLTTAIQRLDESSELAAVLGKAAYERYWSNAPTMERHLEGLLACYSGILSDV